MKVCNIYIFLFLISLISLQCDGKVYFDILTAEVDPKYFTSPNYPDSYPVQAQRIWQILAPTDREIRLQFVELSMDNSRTDNECVSQFVEITNGDLPSDDIPNSYRPNSRKYCGNGAPLPFISKGNKVTVKFQSDSFRSTGISRFKVKYQIVSAVNTPRRISNLPRRRRPIPRTSQKPQLSVKPSGTPTLYKTTELSRLYYDNRLVPFNPHKNVTDFGIFKILATALTALFFVLVVAFVIFKCTRKKKNIQEEISEKNIENLTKSSSIKTVSNEHNAEDNVYSFIVY